LQSIARKPNLYLMELLIMVDALKRASARNIVVVIPYYGYARQDRKGERCIPITAKLVADLLEKAGVHQVITMDLHAEQIVGFFHIPVNHLSALSTLVEVIKQKKYNNLVVVAPDISRAKHARMMARDMKMPCAVVDKQRIDAQDISVEALIGDVRDKDVMLVDDICSTGLTLHNAALLCKKKGAQNIYAAVTHCFFPEESVNHWVIDTLFTTNTIPCPNTIDYGKFELCNISEVFSQSIEHINNTI